MDAVAVDHLTDDTRDGRRLPRRAVLVLRVEPFPTPPPFHERLLRKQHDEAALSRELMKPRPSGLGGSRVEAAVEITPHLSTLPTSPYQPPVFGPLWPYDKRMEVAAAGVMGAASQVGRESGRDIIIDFAAPSAYREAGHLPPRGGRQGLRQEEYERQWSNGDTDCLRDIFQCTGTIPSALSGRRGLRGARRCPGLLRGLR